MLVNSLEDPHHCPNPLPIVTDTKGYPRDTQKRSEKEGMLRNNLTGKQ